MARRCGFHHVALRTQDIDKTVQFYAKLGCTVVRSWGEGDKKAVMLDLGNNNILEMFAGGTAEAEALPRFEHVALRSENVDQDYEDALAAGAVSQKAPCDLLLGGSLPIRIAFVYGPNQELIEFFCEK